MEKTQPRPKQRQPTSVQATATVDLQGDVLCAACNRRVSPLDTYTTEDGEVCGLCHADEDIRDSMAWETKSRIRTLIGVPGYLGMALMVLWPLLAVMVANPQVYFAPVVAFVSLIGWRAVYDAWALDTVQTADRVKLGLTGALVGGLLLAMAIVFML